jgi:hypothetical protein
MQPADNIRLAMVTGGEKGERPVGRGRDALPPSKKLMA